LNDPRDKWNRRWRERLGDELVADPWLLKIIDLLPVGRSLDLACGRGRNALELARRGLTLTAVDCSEEALSQLTAAAAAEGLKVDCQRIDLETQSPELGYDYDLVLCFFFLHRPLLPRMLEAVRPGGLVVLRTFSSAGSFPSSELNARFVLQPQELLSIFAGWEIVRHEEGLEASGKGGSLAGIIARKPLQ
jgi:SAM-dependent methyltransferase